MQVIRLAVVITLGLFVAPLRADAQETTRAARIGFLTTSGNLPESTQAFRRGLHDLGYVEGRNIVTEIRSAEGKPERLPALAAELIALKVDVIVAAGGTSAALAAKQATKTIPIVFPAVDDPETNGLVASLARPGGNLTGLALLSPELVGRCLEQIKEAVPWVSRVAMLWQPGTAPERAEKDMLKETDLAAGALGLRLPIVRARGPEDFPRAFAEIKRRQADALTVLSSPVFAAERRRIAELAIKNRLPTVFAFRSYVDAGGLMSYGPNIADLFRRAAAYVDKILKGAKPADLPVEQPTTFELVVNLKTAKALGLTIPSSMLGRANHVIE
jgi:putative tryptophan/tyrosine transport system substrate-binding protein